MRSSIASLLAALVLFAAPPSRAGRPKRAPPPRAQVRPEDDPRLKGDARAFAKARVAFVAPADLSTLEDGAIRIELRLDRYALGTLTPGGPVPHAHLIVDNEPALEVDSAVALELSGLRPGPHVLRVVLCRPWHELVKAPGAFALTRFWLGRKLEGKAGRAAEFVAWPDPHKPLLTYVLPVGEPMKHAPDLDLSGDGAESAAEQRVPMLDFFVSGGKLARRSNKVRVVLDRRELPLVTEWKPLRLKRARAGTHRLTIDLLDRRGLKLKGALNRTDRAFTVLP